MAQSLTPPPSSIAPSGLHRAAEPDDDSGIVDLAAASQADPQAATRAASTALASHGLFDDETQAQQAPASAAPAAAAPSVSAAAPSASAAPASSVAPAGAPAQAVQEDGAKQKGSPVALFVGVLALGAAAAGGFLYMKGDTAEPAKVEAAPVVAAAEPAAAPVEPAKEEAVKAEPEEATVAATEEAPAEPAAEEAPAPQVVAAAAAQPKTAPAAKAAAPKPAAAPKAAKPEGPAVMTEKDLLAGPSGPAGDLGAAMNKAVGDTGTKATPAAAAGPASRGNVPQKPSQGAVTGALGAVLPGARACLGPDDPVSRAAVVFSSSGTVEAVRVSGGAAGKPAEACIKSALTKAKLQPFAEPTYTANVTIRHN